MQKQAAIIRYRNTVSCPVCKVDKGRMCLTTVFETHIMHIERVDLARQVLGINTQPKKEIMKPLKIKRSNRSDRCNKEDHATCSGFLRANHGIRPVCNCKCHAIVKGKTIDPRRSKSR